RILSGTSGSGSGQVGFAVDPNSGDARTGTITVAGQAFTVAQSALTCSITLTPGAASVASIGGTATFNIAAPAGCSWTTATTATWITIVSAGSGSGAGVVGISAAANPASDARSGTVTVGGQIFTVTQAGPQIRLASDSIANAANYAGGAVSPGLIVVIAVPGIGPVDTVPPQIAGNFFTTQLGETRVLFDGVAAPMVYAANGQFGAIVPYAVAGKDSTQMQIEFKGARSNSITLPVVASSPGLFSLDASGSGPGAILDADFKLNS